MRTILLSFFLVVVPLVGCLGGDGGQSLEEAAESLVGGDEPDARFTPPVKVNTNGYGYEPSIAVGPDHTIYVTAHKAALTYENGSGTGPRTASWFWFSPDNGSSWVEMPSPGQAHEKLFAFEGDVTVDAAGRIYYVDTYAADNTLSRWRTTPEGPAWTDSRPLHATSGADDRPWLVAVGNGSLYYLGNNGAAVPGANSLARQEEAGRIWFYESHDAGTTWSPGTALPGTGWCSLAADANQRVLAACSREDDQGQELGVFVRRGDDPWAYRPVAPFQAQPSQPFPAWSAIDEGGTSYHVWIDDNRTDQEPGRVLVSRSSDDKAYETLDLTPFEGAFGMPWVSAGSPGHVAVTFYGAHTVDTGRGAGWYPFALVTDEADQPDPEWAQVQLAESWVGQGRHPPGDFFESAVGPDDRVHVVFQKELGSGGAGPRAGAYNNDILYVRQVTGPNVG